MSVDYKLIGQRMKSKRRECGKTQEQLAEKLSVTVGYVSQIERGITKVNLDTLSNIAALLNCDISYFVAGVTAENDDYLNTEFNAKIASLPESRKRMLSEIIDVLIKY